MTSLGDMLGASARMELLRALYYQDEAVGLRQLSRLAAVHPHSAERMLERLVEEELVVRQKARSRTWFSRSPEHADWHVLGAVFDAADRSMRDLARPALQQRARALLPLIQEARSLLARAKRGRRVA